MSVVLWLALLGYSGFVGVRAPLDLLRFHDPHLAYVQAVINRDGGYVASAGEHIGPPTPRMLNLDSLMTGLLAFDAVSDYGRALETRVLATLDAFDWKHNRHLSKAFE